MRKTIRAKPHRLAMECYQGEVTAAFTCCVEDKTQFITKKEIVSVCEEILFTESVKLDCDVLAYIFMPDHCHILLKGNSEKSNVFKVIKSYKQKSGFWFSNNCQEIKWQKSFYDHILWTDVEIDKHMRYILENPMRKEIVQDWKEYPWKGSMVYDLNEWCP